MILSDNLQVHALAVADLAAGGAIGTAAATVDRFENYRVKQTTAGQTLSLPNPTQATDGHVVSVLNIGTVPFTMHGAIVDVQSAEIFHWSGTAWLPIAQTTGLQKFRVVQALAAGANVITHSLGLTTPFATEVEVRDDSNGALITARVTVEAANAVTIDVGSAVASARITVIG